MPTIGHLIIGIILPLTLYYILRKKISIETELYFIAGSILPDTYTIIKLFIFPDIVRFIPINHTHGIVFWILLSFAISGIVSILLYNFSLYKLTQIFIILTSAGLLHFGLDMLTEPVNIIGDFYLSIYSFYTPFMILEEQDFITVFYFIFLIVPILLLIIEIKRET